MQSNHWTRVNSYTMGDKLSRISLAYTEKEPVVQEFWELLLLYILWDDLFRNSGDFSVLKRTVLLLLSESWSSAGIILVGFEPTTLWLHWTMANKVSYKLSLHWKRTSGARNPVKNNCCKIEVVKYERLSWADAISGDSYGLHPWIPVQGP